MLQGLQDLACTGAVVFDLGFCTASLVARSRLLECCLSPWHGCDSSGYDLEPKIARRFGRELWRRMAKAKGEASRLQGRE